MKILIVDDSKSILDMVKDILISGNYIIETAENGADALSKYYTFKPDLVILDIAMPVMDGMETLTKIFTIDKAAKIIMMSAMEQDDLIIRCFEKGASGFLIKPFTKEQLISSIRDCSLGRRNVQMLFKCAENKIEASIKKILDVNTSISLISVSISDNPNSRQTSNTINMTTIYAVPEIKPLLNTEKSERWYGYVSEIRGQQVGKVISFMENNDLKDDFPGSKLMELFEIINMKVISLLADSTGLTLNGDSVRPYDHNKDVEPFSHEIAIASYKMTYRERPISIEIQLCFNLRQIFNRKF